MLRSYFIIAYRNLWRNKTFSLINISGLGIGLAVCILIFLYTKDELSYDRFHEKKDELYQLTCKLISKDGQTTEYGIGGAVQGPEFKAGIPEIKSFVRVSEDELIVKNGNELFKETVSWVDNNFFSVFSFPLIAGTPRSVLSGINSVVLSEDMAEKYFGKENAMGKILEFEIQNKREPFVVTGIAKRSPENSSIKFKILLPFENKLKHDDYPGWFMLSYPTFLVMSPGADLKRIAKKMEAVYLAKADVAKERKNGMEETFVWGAQPFLNMHLNTEVEASPNSSDPLYSYILSAIALLILLIACINFINLTIAQSLQRSKEIGLRKVIGGQRKQLVFQFMGESLVMCLVAFILAFIVVELLLPGFNTLVNKQLSLGYLTDISLLSGFLLLFLATALISGFYPALVLSKFDPVRALQNKQSFTGKNYLSRILIVVQFALATFLVTGTLFIYSQFNYMMNKDLGYNDKNVLMIRTGQGRNKDLMRSFKNEFEKIRTVQQVAPRMEGAWTTNSKANGKDIDVKYEHVDANYFATMQIPLLEGRNFSDDFPGDSTNSVIINEAYARAAGWEGSPLGKRIDFLNGRSRKLTVVGLVKDYHFESLKAKIRPQLFSVENNLPFGRFLLRINPDNTAATVKEVEAIYRRLLPYRPFEYTFISDDNLEEYASEARWRQIITFSAGFAIFISCIGLLGLTMLSVQKRTKEIGIRKVLGATVFHISALVSENFMLLVFIAFLIAIPASWYAVNKWLQNFAYHIEINWYIFAAASLLIMFVALFTISINALKAAAVNPAKNLRTE